MPKTAKNRVAKRGIEATKRVRYARRDMGRPPQPPRSYVTRHLRFRRAIDVAIRTAAAEERRGFNDLVQLVMEDWLAERARTAAERETTLAPPRRRRQPGKPPRKP